jgi:predicted DNA-binding antitoxin AbrB/MazE fold protein
MRRQFEAVFENGVLRPLEALPLSEQDRVTITISYSDDWHDGDYTAMARAESDSAVTIEDVRQALSTIEGSLADVAIALRGDY